MAFVSEALVSSESLLVCLISSSIPEKLLSMCLEFNSFHSSNTELLSSSVFHSFDNSNLPNTSAHSDLPSSLTLIQPRSIARMLFAYSYRLPVYIQLNGSTRIPILQTPLKNTYTNTTLALSKLVFAILSNDYDPHSISPHMRIHNRVRDDTALMSGLKFLYSLCRCSASIKSKDSLSTKLSKLSSYNSMKSKNEKKTESLLTHEFDFHQSSGASFHPREVEELLEEEDAASLSLTFAHTRGYGKWVPAFWTNEMNGDITQSIVLNEIACDICDFLYVPINPPALL